MRLQDAVAGNQDGIPRRLQETYRPFQCDTGGHQRVSQYRLLLLLLHGFPYIDDPGLIAWRGPVPIPVELQARVGQCDHVTCPSVSVDGQRRTERPDDVLQPSQAMQAVVRVVPEPVEQARLHAGSSREKSTEPVHTDRNVVESVSRDPIRYAELLVILTCQAHAAERGQQVEYAPVTAKCRVKQRPFSQIGVGVVQVFVCEAVEVPQEVAERRIAADSVGHSLSDISDFLGQPAEARAVGEVVSLKKEDAV